jgi:hypothetical protein
MRKSLWIVSLLLVAISAPNAHADSNQVGTVAVTDAICSGDPSEFCGTVFVSNLMSDTALNILGYTFDGTPTSAPLSLNPGATQEYLMYSATPTINLGLFGDIANSNFTLGGEPFHATNLNWSTDMWAVEFNGTLGINVTSAPPTVPEPNSLGLILTGIGFLALMITIRKRSPLGQRQGT